MTTRSYKPKRLTWAEVQGPSTQQWAAQSTSGTLYVVRPDRVDGRWLALWLGGDTWRKVLGVHPSRRDAQDACQLHAHTREPQLWSAPVVIVRAPDNIGLPTRTDMEGWDSARLVRFVQVTTMRLRKLRVPGRNDRRALQGALRVAQQLLQEREIDAMQQHLDDQEGQPVQPGLQASNGAKRPRKEAQVATATPTKPTRTVQRAASLAALLKSQDASDDQSAVAKAVAGAVSKPHKVQLAKTYFTILDADGRVAVYVVLRKKGVELQLRLPDAKAAKGLHADDRAGGTFGARVVITDADKAADVTTKALALIAAR